MKIKEIRREIRAVVKLKPGIRFWALLPEVEKRLSNKRSTVAINADAFQRQVTRMVKWGKIKHKWSTEPPREPHFYPAE